MNPGPVKKIKTLETLAAEQVLKGINPIYYPKLLSTLFEEMGYRAKLYKDLRKCRTLLWEVLHSQQIDLSNDIFLEEVICEHCGFEEVRTETPYVYELNDTGSRLIVGGDGDQFAKKTMEIYEILEGLKQYFK